METFTRTPHLERPDRTNWSTLKYMGTSPLHYLHNLDHPRTDSAALLLGRLTHAMVFERDQVESRYALQPHFNRAMNDDTARAKGLDGGKQAAAAWDESVGGRDVVKIDQWDAARWMRDALLADPVAGPIVSTGWSERKIEWTDPVTGVLCRARVDHLNGILADLKTTRNLPGFEKDCVRFGYHAQLPWYADGCALAGIELHGPPCLIAVENTAPFDVQVLVFEEDDLAVGRRVYRACLTKLAACRASGEWPGVSGGVARRVQLPAWADPIMDDAEVIIDGVAVRI